MSGRAKLTASHLRRSAFVYVRQSTQAQTERNRESTERQYALVARAVELGFAREQVELIDEDLGVSGSGDAERAGLRAPGGRGRARPRRAGARPRGLAPGAQQRRLVPAA